MDLITSKDSLTPQQVGGKGTSRQEVIKMKWQHRRCKHCVNCKEYINDFGQKRFMCLAQIVDICPENLVCLLDCEEFKQINFRWEKQRKRQLKALNRPIQSNVRK